jgi:hypothetical protein
MNTSQKAKKLLAEDMNLEPGGSRFISCPRQIWIDLTRKRFALNA